MKDHGLLFQDDMVLAYLEGRKTQTRRPAKLTSQGLLKLRGNRAAVLRDHGPVWCPAGGDSEQPLTGPDLERHSPFGQAGDRLWVREAAMLSTMSGSGGITDTIWLNYRAGNDRLCPTHHREDPGPYQYDRWTPSMSMPRWAARLVLPIVSVRVERVRDITERDARAEGVERLELTSGILPDVPPPFNRVHPMTSSYREAFLTLWRELYGTKHPPETAWCWVVETEPYQGANK
jgi:hypothetical protein